MAISHVASLRDLTPKRIQADELHAFVAAKQRNVEYMAKSKEDAGTVWAYLAMCADSKLIFSYQLGDHCAPNAKLFAKDIASKLKRSEQGDSETRPLIVTDGLLAYDEAFDVAFGSDADRATIIKRYETPENNGKRGRRRYIGADREVRVGDANLADVHTSYIERQNGNLRMGNRRYNRKTNAFSKTLLNHERHLALWIMYHNLCWVPRPGRPTRDANGKRGPWIKKLPAGIAAGITDHLWEIKDLLALTDEFIARRRTTDTPVEPLPSEEKLQKSDDAGLPTHWVFHHLIHRQTKVHRSDCVNCRGGLGKTDGAKKTGRWHPFYYEEDAVAAAIEIEPDKHSICKMCMGFYNTLGYRHSGSSRQSPTKG